MAEIVEPGNPPVMESGPPPLMTPSPPPLMQPSPPPVMLPRPVPLHLVRFPGKRRRWPWRSLAAMLLIGLAAWLGPALKRGYDHRLTEHQATELVNAANACINDNDLESADALARRALELLPGFEPAERSLAAAAALRQREFLKTLAGHDALARAESWLQEDRLDRTIAAMERIRVNEAAYGRSAVETAEKRLGELRDVTGTLVLPADWPADAELLVNGEPPEITGGRITGLPLGRLRVTASRPKFRPPPPETVEITGARPVSLPGPEWSPLPGRVRIGTSPEGAAVWLDNTDTGLTTPCEIPEAPAGQVTYTLRLPGHAEATVRGELPPDGSLELSAALTELPLLPENGAQAGERRLFNITPALRVPFRWCPPGSFVMGAARTGNADERPSRKVGFSHGFWLAETEFTQGQWEAVMGRESLNRLRLKNTGTLPDEADAPVSNLSWDDLRGSSAPGGGVFNRINQYLKDNHRGEWVADLPTEAQWEYACRAGSGNAFSTEPPNEAGLLKSAWFAANSGGRYHAVGTREPNPWGFHDMHGNVAEWCRDNYQPSYLHLTDRDPGGPQSGWKRVHRGGAYFSPAAQCRSSARGSAYSQTIHPGIGFRLALRPEKAPPTIAPPPPPPPKKTKK